MKVTIDNQDGKGPIDYSAALCADQATETAVVITRALNQPAWHGSVLIAQAAAWKFRRQMHS